MLDVLYHLHQGIMPQIEVTFDIDANNIVSMSHKDKNTGKEQKITTRHLLVLSEIEIEQTKDAEQTKKQTRRSKRRLINKKPCSMVFVASTEKALEEHGDKISAEAKTKIETTINDLKDIESKTPKT